MHAHSDLRTVVATTPRGTKLRSRLTHGMVYLFLVCMGIIALAPFYFMASGALMARGEMFKIPPRLWPASPVWGNFKVIFEEYHFLTYLRNSVIISVAQTLGVLFVCSL